MNFLINIILDLLFPRRCPVCGQIVMPKGSLICPGCVKKLSWVRGPVCKCCGKEIISGTMEYCPDCAAHPRSFSHGMALFNYNEISAPSLAMVKYHDRRDYLDFYAEPLPGCHRTGSSRCRSTKAGLKNVDLTRQRNLENA